MLLLKIVLCAEILLLLCRQLSCRVVDGPPCRVNSKCLILTRCTSFMDLINGLQKPLKPSVVEFLRSQQCGFENGYPKVCCTALPRGLKVYKGVSTISTSSTTTRSPSINSDLQKTFFIDLSTIVEITTTTALPKITGDEVAKKKNKFRVDFHLDMVDLYEDLSPFLLVRKKRHNYWAKDVEIR